MGVAAVHGLAACCEHSEAKRDPRQHPCAVRITSTCASPKVSNHPREIHTSVASRFKKNSTAEEYAHDEQSYRKPANVHLSQKYENIFYLKTTGMQ